ncbi:radical SAM protein [Acidobacteriota bacterium]
MVVYEVTHLCNQECKYCDRRSPGPDEMSLSQIKQAIDSLCDLGMVHISLDGGEALVHPQIAEIVDHLISRSVSVYMNSNGELVPRKLEVVRKLSKLKVSLDGPEDVHDAARGDGTWKKAMQGIRAAQDEGVPVELSAVIGSHNAHAINEMIDLVEREGLQIICQPARPSLLQGGEGGGADYVPSREQVRQTIKILSHRKRSSGAVGNRWSSLQHFTKYPDDAALPCAAGWINVTMDPFGNLYSCGQLDRSNTSHNILSDNPSQVFKSLNRKGCTQCWCTRVVEENYFWGLELYKMRPIGN